MPNVAGGVGPRKRTITCVVSGRERRATPEEAVLQSCARALIEVLGYDRRDLEIQFPIKLGSRTYWIDLAVFPPGRPHAQDQVYAVVECKRPRISAAKRADAINQMKSYAAACDNAHFVMFVGSTDGTDREAFEVVRRPGVGYQYVAVPMLPAATAELRTRFTIAAQRAPGGKLQFGWTSVPIPRDARIPVAVGGGIAVLVAVGSVLAWSASGSRGDDRGPVPPMPASTQASNALPGVTSACIARPDATGYGPGFLVRPLDSMATSGPSLLSRTPVQVLGRGNPHPPEGRRSFLVRASDGMTGYVFLSESRMQMAGPCSQFVGW